jgi:trans-aconitate methyltransferase
MDRILEPELMDDLEQARAYAEADFAEPNSHFVELFLERFPDWDRTGAILDLGCGPGDIALRLAETFPQCEIHGVDGSAAMLQFAEAAGGGSAGRSLSGRGQQQPAASSA